MKTVSDKEYPLMTNHTAIHTDNAPKALGPYSQGTKWGDLIFTAGQVAIDPATNSFIGGDITAQTHQVLKNLQAVLQEGGSDFSKVLKTTVYLTTMDNFAAMNAVYKEYMSGIFPGRTTIAVAQLPLGALVEIECVAYTE
jgi:2-iminobutanoate/2-iminopropanoate deaminase